MLLLFAVVSFTACKNDTVVNPTPTPLAEKFVGTYTVNSFQYTDTDPQVNLYFPKLPTTNNEKAVSGTVSLVKKTDTTLDMKFLMKGSGVNDWKMDFPDLEVRQVGSEYGVEYGLFLEGTRIADVEGTGIIYHHSETDRQTKGKTGMVYIAKREL